MLVLKESDYPCENYQLIAFVICHFPLILQHVITEPFEPSPFMPSVNKEFEDDFNFPANRQQRQQTYAEPLGSLPKSEKENNSVAKIKVVVGHSLSTNLFPYFLIVLSATFMMTRDLWETNFFFVFR